MGLRIRTDTGYDDLYVLFRGTEIAVEMAEGTDLDLCWYEASDADIAAAELPAGEYEGAFLHGDFDVPDPRNDEEGTFSGFVWDGSAQALSGVDVVSIARSVEAAELIKQEKVSE